MLFAAVRDYVSIPARSGISVFILAPGRAFLNNFFKKRAAVFLFLPSGTRYQSMPEERGMLLTDIHPFFAVNM